jgi:hypothetical protein
VPWVSASGKPEERDLKLVFVPARDPANLRNRLYVNATEDSARERERLVELGATGEAPNPAIPVIPLVEPGGTSLVLLADP